jgi:hypothetical protein
VRFDGLNKANAGLDSVALAMAQPDGLSSASVAIAECPSPTAAAPGQAGAKPSVRLSPKVLDLCKAPVQLTTTSANAKSITATTLMGVYGGSVTHEADGKTVTLSFAGLPTFTKETLPKRPVDVAVVLGKQVAHVKQPVKCGS